MCQSGEELPYPAAMPPEVAPVGRGETVGRVVRLAGFQAIWRARPSVHRDSRVRMSTLYLDLLWREIRFGGEAFQGADRIAHAFMIKYHRLLESAKDFAAIGVSDEIKYGDIVNWRHPKHAGSHTVIYLGKVAGSANEFVGIEANRTDDNAKDGIDLGVFKLERPDMRTAILRRKW